jgi:hypothetical protein
MGKVIFKFESAKDLWEFKAITKANCVELNLKEYTLICDYDEAEIELAMRAYNAQVKQYMVTS